MIRRGACRMQKEKKQLLFAIGGIVATGAITTIALSKSDKLYEAQFKKQADANVRHNIDEIRARLNQLEQEFDN